MRVHGILESKLLLSSIKKAITIISGMLFLVLSTRYLGPYLRGEYVYILNIVTIVSTVLNLGICNIAPNYYRKYKQAIKNSYFTISIIQMLFYLFLTVLFYIYGTSNSGVILLLSTFSVLSTQLNGLSLLLDFKGNALAYIISGFVNMVMILIAYFWLEPSLSIVLYFWLIKEIIISIIIMYRMKPSLITPSIKWFSIIKDARFPLYITILISLNYRIGVVFLKWLNIDIGDIGIYALGVSIAEYSWIFTDVFKDYLVNINSKKSNTTISSLSMRLSFSIIFICLLVALVIGKPMLVLLFGDEFSSSYFTMMLMFVAVPFMSHTKLVGTIFQAEGKWFTYIAIMGSAALINIILCLSLIPIYQTTGAAIAAMASYVFSGTLSLIWYCKTYNLEFKSQFIIDKQDLKFLFKTKNEDNI